MTQTTKSLGKLGKFEILAELGRGSYGVVYRARDPVLEREVALKVIHPRLLVQAEFVQRFFLEARVAARLDHPNIVPIHDVVESGGSLFIVMKLLEGKSLQRFIESKAKLEPAQAVPLLAQVGSAVDYAHSKGVLHRDLKPANVMVREDGHATLTDFGLAKALSESYASSGEKQAGTMPYMAPEEFDAGFGEVGPATDLYALGIMAYEMLGGQVPFRGSSTQIMHGHCMAAVPAVGGLAPGVSEVLERALAKKPSERFGSAEEFVAALRGALATAVRQEVRQEPAAPLDVPKANGAPQVPQPTGVPKAGATKLLGTTGITLVWVPPGTYWMGAADSDRGASRDEKPRHQVELDGYWIGQTQVTNAQYQRFIDAGGYSTRSYWSDAGWTWKTSNGVTQPGCWGDSKWNGADQPVVEVSWYEAEAYAKWAGGRLPTEAEWEAAARGGPLSKGYTYAGSNDVGSVAWYEDNSGGVTHAVKGKAPNELGLYDMSGNVYEWVADLYSGGNYASSPTKNPTGSTSGSKRAVRGGSWHQNPAHVRCACRGWVDPGNCHNDVGFRVAGLRQETAAPLDVPKANGAPQVPQPTGVPKAGAKKLLGSTGITLVYVPAGQYWIGSLDSDSNAYDNEKPRHQVELDGYWIGQTVVTNAQYRQFIEAGGYSARSYWSDAGWSWKTSHNVAPPRYWGDSRWNGAEQPVVAVSWYEAEAYCRWAGGRLPTEAEWEAAARGGPLSKGYTYAGSNDVGTVAWYEDNSGGVTHAVKGKAPNELGLYDMSGNVREWVADWYESTYYASSPRKNPSGPTSGSERVLRGGSWISGPTDVCGTDRATIAPGHRSSIVGFRVAQ